MTNDVNYFEIGSSNPEASRTFYRSLFDWKIDEPSSPGQYSAIGEDRGGLWDTSKIGSANYATFYVQVDDVRGSIEQAEKLGATVLVPYVDNGAIEFGHLADPQGNRFGVWRPKDAG